MIVTTKTTRGMVIKVLNYAKYQDPKNYESNNESDNGATMEQQFGDTINKKEKKEKKEKNITKVIQDKPVVQENQLITNLITDLKAFTGLEQLDGTIKENRNYAYLLVKNKITPEFKKRAGNEPTDNEIRASFSAILNNADDFHHPNITAVKYVYYHFGKLIKLKKSKFISI